MSSTVGRLQESFPRSARHGGSSGAELDKSDVDTYIPLVKRTVKGEALPLMPCACASIRRAARATTQLYDRALRDTGLNTAQFTLLQALAQAGPLTQGRLGHALALDSTTLSRTLRPLEARRWVRCQPGEDRRERLISLTATGQAQLERALPNWERAQSRLRGRLGGERWNDLLTELAKLAGAARDA
jgi:DNA-binding MarR family transcriptional regulator